MFIKNYTDLITNLPYQEQAFTIKRSNWSKYISAIDSNRFFKESNEITLSRMDLFHGAEEMESFIVKTLMWGYPTGGRGDNIQKVLKKDSLSLLVDILCDYKNGNISNERFTKDLSNIEGVGISTLSKFTYFLQTSIEGYSSLILDERIMRVINEVKFNELKDLGKYNRENAGKKYSMYIKLMDELAKDMSVRADQIELFLFMFGQNLKE
ncbi:hypothetical protein SAMN04487906_0497 [Zhouia amylolytica]|uniref:Uncharacterized protein n=1 Tax=Zhouia amylolytica TaxID=376730 RepID=A0A1I6PVW2_9FLAO|nr:hypothetical protein [Zhouia amylolytica]SFS44185.1 hypothetical protein SAMN04487906_0497 [Zhouia amylolytica]